MFISFDYSLTSPCMCISPTDSILDARFWFLSDKKKYSGVFLNGKVTGTLHKEWSTPEQRYENISQHFIEIAAKEAANVTVVIEDYSMGSKGKVFHIGENAGLLKWKLWARDHKLVLLAPTALKKFATGKGNADKIVMAAAFTQQTGIQMTEFGTVGTSPSSDIIDAWFLMKYAYTIKE